MKRRAFALMLTIAGFACAAAVLAASPPQELAAHLIKRVLCLDAAGILGMVLLVRASSAHVRPHAARIQSGLCILVIGFAATIFFRRASDPSVLVQALLILLHYAVGVTGVAVVLRACQDLPSKRNPLVRFLASPSGSAVTALLLVVILGMVFDGSGAFYKLGTHRDALRQASVLGILACGMTLVIIAGGIDLSVASVLALVAVCFSLMSIHWGWPAWLVLPLCLAIGAACGGVSGVLTASLRIQPFIATLAMMVFARGLAKLASGGTKIYTNIPNADGSFRSVELPEVFTLMNSRILGENVSVVTVVFLACAAAAWLMLARHRWGRELYAIGGNEEAARLSGVSVARVKTLAYVAAGALAAVAGLCYAAQEQQGDPEAGRGYELFAIEMVVIGGTNLMGGRGGIGLTLIGVLTIGYLEKILSLNAVPEAWRLMLTGVIVVAAVLTQRRRLW